jgi:hypothetical protein
MRYIPLIYQSTEVWNGLSQKDKDVFVHPACWPHAQHRGVEDCAAIRGGREQG